MPRQRFEAFGNVCVSEWDGRRGTALIGVPFTRMPDPDDALMLRRYGATLDLDYAPEGEDPEGRHWFRVSWPPKRTPSEKHFLALVRDQSFYLSGFQRKGCRKC